MEVFIIVLVAVLCTGGGFGPGWTLYRAEQTLREAERRLWERDRAVYIGEFERLRAEHKEMTKLLIAKEPKSQVDGIERVTKQYMEMLEKLVLGREGPDLPEDSNNTSYINPYEVTGENLPLHEMINNHGFGDERFDPPTYTGPAGWTEGTVAS